MLKELTVNGRRLTNSELRGVNQLIEAIEAAGGKVDEQWIVAWKNKRPARAVLGRTPDNPTIWNLLVGAGLLKSVGAGFGVRKHPKPPKYNCVVCRKQLTTPLFDEGNGNPFCQEHYSTNTQVCDECGQIRWVKELRKGICEDCREDSRNN